MMLSEIAVELKVVLAFFVCRKRVTLPAAAGKKAHSVSADSARPTSAYRPISAAGSRLFAHEAMANTFEEERIPSTLDWAKGRHIELGIAEMNPVILITECGRSQCEARISSACRRRDPKRSKRHP